jgi:hypothetical protein
VGGERALAFGEGAMLQKLGDHIRICYERAAEAAADAKTAADKKQRDSLLKLEATWLHLAKSYEFVQRLEAFLMNAHRRTLEAKVDARKRKVQDTAH